MRVRSVPVTEWQVAEVQFILDEVARFARMTFDEWAAHIKISPDDGFCELDRPGSQGGHLNVSRAAFNSFHRLTAAAVESQPDACDFDREKVERELRKQFIEFFLNQKRQDDEAVTEMLVTALVKAAEKHRQRTHWLPCVLLASKQIPDFHVGPVRFFTKERFLDEHAPAFEALRQRELDVTLAAVRDPSKREKLSYKTEEEAIALANTIVSTVIEYFAAYEWVAEVTIPACAPAISFERAQNAVQGALDILKMHFGSRAEHVRLGHHRATPRETSQWWRENAVFDYRMSWSGEDIIVQDTWMEEVIGPNQFYFRSAAEALHGYVNPTQDSDLAQRFRDALFWYGQGITERIPAARIVKFAAALERMTITSDERRGFEDKVVNRCALLSGGSPEGERLRRKETKSVYEARSTVMHGKSSPLQSDVEEAAALALSLTRSSLFGFLYVCWLISRKGIALTDASLDEFYLQTLNSPRRREPPADSSERAGF